MSCFSIWIYKLIILINYLLNSSSIKAIANGTEKGSWPALGIW